MSPQARWEYMKSVHERYQEARGKREKGRILDEFYKTYGCHRKHALRMLNGPAPGEGGRARRRRGSPYDRPRLLAILEAVWKASGQACGQRLKALLPRWMPWIRQRFRLSREEERLLLAMGSATIDRKLRAKKDGLRRRIYGRTRPGRWLKHQIPIKTDSWDVDRPGFMEVDLVSHSGDCAEGNFAYTLNMTDVYSGWVERRCVLGKSQQAVLQGIASIRRELPFPLLGLDSDNGSEFVNHHLWDYCQADPQVRFTRGRPYKKDDNAHVEQKNWTHVRKLMGYGRYDKREVLAAINDLYRHELRWLQNLFLPSFKLAAKVRVGSKLRRRYHAPKMPLERVAESKHRNKAKLAEIERLSRRLDPFALSEAIERKLERIWRMRSKAPRPAWHRLGKIPSYRFAPPDGPPLPPQLPTGMERLELISARDRLFQTQ